MFSVTVYITRPLTTRDVAKQKRKFHPDPHTQFAQNYYKVLYGSMYGFDTLRPGAMVGFNSTNTPQYIRAHSFITLPCSTIRKRCPTGYSGAHPLRGATDDRGRWLRVGVGIQTLRRESCAPISMSTSLAATRTRHAKIDRRAHTQPQNK